MLNKKIKFVILSVVFILTASAASAANLQDAFKTGDGSSDDPLDKTAQEAGYDTGQTGVNPIISTVIQVALSFLGVIFLILIIYGGILWMTAGGNQEKLSKAHSLIRSAIIGLIIVVGAYAISWFVISTMSEETLDSPDSSSSKVITHFYS